jgi:GYF domain 2
VQLAQKVCNWKRKTIVGSSAFVRLRVRSWDFQRKFDLFSPEVVQPTPATAHRGINMADRSWFFASQGAQHGPYPEAQFREFIAQGRITADTLVWTEGMANWQNAGDIPGLFSDPSGPPVFPQSGGSLTNADGHAGGPLSIEFGIWEFVWRSLVLSFGLVLVIPAPWALLMYCRWIVSCVRIPQRPNLVFTGRAVELMWFYAFVILNIGAAWSGSAWLNLALFIIQFLLFWLLVKWFLAHLSSNGQPLGLSFDGSFWGFLGWSLLASLSFLTIIGWAWVYVAQINWMCRHIGGTRRDVVFNGTGLELLWRTFAIVLGFAGAAVIAGIFASLLPGFLKNIVGFALFVLFAVGALPWAYRWQLRWLVSQIALVEKYPQAHV